MPSPAHAFEAEAKDRALRRDLRRRIERVARDDPQALGSLQPWEFGLLLVGGLALPLGLAWWAL